MVHIASTWRRMRHRYNLYGNKCVSCKSLFFPPRVLCPKCRRAGKMEEVKFKGRGKIVSFTEISVPPEGYELQVPYVLAIVELEEGPRITTQIVECNYDDVDVGMPVEMVFRRLVEDEDCGLIHYGFKFRPALLKNQTEDSKSAGGKYNQTGK